MKKRLFTYLIICLSFTTVVGQSVSSFSNTTQVSKNEIEKQLLYAEALFNTDLSKALTIIEDNLLIAIDNSYKLEEALAYRILGDFNFELTNYSLGLSNFKKALTIYKNEKQSAKVLSLYNKTGKAYTALKNYSGALKMYEKALEKSKFFKRPIRQVEVNYQIAEVYYAQKNYSKSKVKFTEVYGETSSKFGAGLNIKSLMGLGKIAWLNTEISQAEKLFKEAKQLANQLNKDKLANQAFDLLTQLYQTQNDLTSEIQVQQQAFDFNSNRGNSNSMFNNSINLSNEFVKQGKEKEALDLLNSQADVVEQEETSIEKIEFIKTLAKVYEENGLVEQAKIENQKYEKLLDSFLVNKQKQDGIQSSKIENLKLSENKLLLMEKDRDLNEKMIAVLKREQAVKDDTIQRQLTITYMLLGGLIIIGILTFFLLRSRKQQQKNNKLLMLKSLRSQMNPHFIFNSLNSVNSFIAKKDERSANKYLAEFSKLMREVLECSQQDFIPLSKEGHILKLYLNLEHFRFNSHFDFTFEVDSNINLDDYQIPPMLLQPFIENAIWHGLRYKETKGHLWVKFSQTKDCVAIEISDNGIGRKASAKVKTINQKKMKSTGIKNIENRLEIIRSVFKKNLDITIQDYDLTNETGTKVNVKLH